MRNLINNRADNLDPSQYRVRDLFVAISLICCLLAASAAAWRRGSAPSAIEFYVAWTLIVLCNALFGRSTCRFGQSENTNYSQAYKAAWATGRVQQLAWLVVSLALLIGHFVAGSDVSSVLRCFVAPLMLLVPIGIVANAVSLAIVCDLHDIRFIGYRLTSIAATLVPAIWVLVESNR